MGEYKGTPTQAQSWGNTTLLIKGKEYIGVREYTPPEEGETIEWVYTIGSTPSRYVVGTEEITEFSITMLEETINELKYDLFNGDMNAKWSDASFSMVEIINPKNGGRFTKMRTTFETVKISKVTRASRSQGGGALESNVTFMVTKPKMELIE